MTLDDVPWIMFGGSSEWSLSIEQRAPLVVPSGYIGDYITPPVMWG